jgi:hypothetical protein
LAIETVPKSLHFQFLIFNITFLTKIFQYKKAGLDSSIGWVFDFLLLASGSSGYFKSLKEPEVIMKEWVKNRRL